MRKKIRVGVIGVGICTSSLVQGVSYYSNDDDFHLGIMNFEIGGYRRNLGDGVSLII